MAAPGNFAHLSRIELGALPAIALRLIERNIRHASEIAALASNAGAIAMPMLTPTTAWLPNTLKGPRNVVDDFAACVFSIVLAVGIDA